jgi:hypothetical protein
MEWEAIGLGRSCLSGQQVAYIVPPLCANDLAVHTNVSSLAEA